MTQAQTRSKAALVALAAVLVLLAALVATQDARAQGSTRVVVYDPFRDGEGLRQGLRVARVVAGRCPFGSVATPWRSDAWRCFAGNAVLDPCFTPRHGGGDFLACVQDPWDRRIVELQLTRPLGTPNKARWRGNLPWAIELYNGERCTFDTGATAGVRGMRINYDCTRGGELIGQVYHSRHPWRIHWRSDKTKSNLRLAKIRVAYW